MGGGGGGNPPCHPPPPTTKVTIAGKNRIYHWENLVGPVLVHTLLPPPPPPSLLIHPWLDPVSESSFSVRP